MSTDPPKPPPSSRTQLGCTHYNRKCKIVAPCCNKVYWCRICHDEFTCSHQNIRSNPKSVHQIDRFKIKKLVCQLCDLEQSVKERCEKCDVRFAKYICLKCNLFDEDDSKGQYHCDKCGICRVGGGNVYIYIFLSFSLSLSLSLSFSLSLSLETKTKSNYKQHITFFTVISVGPASGHT